MPNTWFLNNIPKAYAKKAMGMLCLVIQNKSNSQKHAAQHSLLLQKKCTTSLRKGPNLYNADGS